jgi:tryptophan-rich sensory protein
VFGVAWTLLYALYGASLFIAYRAGGRRWTPAIVLAVVTLAAMVAWPIVFFSVDAPIAAFASIVGLAGLATATATVFLKLGPAFSGALLLPLVAWLTFASYLSFARITDPGMRPGRR